MTRLPSGPMCKREVEWCPFPAAALMDPWRAKKWPPALPLDAGDKDREEGEVEEKKRGKKKRRGGAKAKKQRQHRAAAAAAAAEKHTP